MLKFKDGNIYRPIEFNNAQLSGRRNTVITNPNFSIEFNDGVPSLLVNIDGVNVNVSNYVAPQPPTPPVPPTPPAQTYKIRIQGSYTDPVEGEYTITDGEFFNVCYKPASLCVLTGFRDNVVNVISQLVDRCYTLSNIHEDHIIDVQVSCK